MGILDNDTVIVDAILTKLGRDKLRQGQPLGISQYAFGDTGVDYNLYNPDHPSGSDAYGSAITALPQLEAVPDDDVFMRTRLFGTGERGIQNYGFIDLPDGLTRSISSIPGGIESTAIVLRPRVFSSGTELTDSSFKFTILDHRGLRATIGGNSIVGNAFSSVDPDKRSAVGTELQLNAQSGQISRQVTRTVRIELEGDGAAPVQATITVEVNNTVDSGTVGDG
ncbi:MAG: hypothetical protein CBD63_04555 [Candidatus Pelagibacter sp. TMED203]|nr:MAG: hypothetical protein CBD63_04555 [Candidatus Pelagibacter sp. TMED203]|tara:strand:+ start:3506 stop:4177 length:672 start_codon:yes stop_codon:yes gene_type:complete